MDVESEKLNFARRNRAINSLQREDFTNGSWWIYL